MLDGKEEEEIKKLRKKEEEQNRDFHVRFSRHWGEVMGLWGCI